MRNGEHPILMLCQERAPFPCPVVDSHPRVEKKFLVICWTERSKIQKNSNLQNYKSLKKVLP